MTTVAQADLSALERWLVAVGTHPAGAAAGIAFAERLHAGAPSLGALEGVVTPGARLTALERIAIYNDGYFARLVECLADDYPAVRHALGEAEFERAARAYIDAQPSRSPSLNAYGAEFPRFLAGRREAFAPFAAELARLEWAVVEVIHADAGAPLAPDVLARIRPEEWSRARLVPKPALRLLDFARPVNAYYQAFRDEADPSPPPAGASHVLVHRVGMAVYRLELSRPMRFLLGALLAGEALAVALAELERSLPPAELDGVRAEVGSWFGAWINAGLFQAVVVD